MSNNPDVKITPAEGKLGVLIPGLGAVTTTFVAEIEAVRRGLGKRSGRSRSWRPYGSASATENRSPLIKDFVPLAGLDDWLWGHGIFSKTTLRPLEMSLLDQLKDGLCAIKPMPALFDREYVKMINGPNVKTSGSKMDKAEMLTDDIRGSRNGPTPRG